MSTRLVVDRLRCDGRGACAELFPEMISLDDWGYPILAPSSVPDHLLPMAREAVSSCPVLALRLARVGAGAAALTAISQPPVTVLQGAKGNSAGQTASPSPSTNLEAHGA